MYKDLFKFLDASATSFNAIATIKNILKANDYQELKENNFKIQKGKKYFLIRNDASIIAFNIGKRLKDASLHCVASHSDCPLLKLKPQPILFDKEYIKLNVEIYGSPILETWFDRPLKLAGRILIKHKGKIKTIIYDGKKAIGIIPSIAPHIKKKDYVINPQIDLLPLITLDKNFDFEEYLAQELKCLKKDILAFDLFLVPMFKASTLGINDELFASNHIDNLECAYTNLRGFINHFHDDNINIYLCFDNEEVGSLTRQGADSNFFEMTLRRVCQELKIDYYNLLDSAMMLSCDNGHAIHPNHFELADPSNAPTINGGIVIKYNARQSYTSEGIGIALIKDLMHKHKIKYQFYTNRSDQKGGSTLGNLANRHVSILTIDIGLAQLAMHSAYEIAGIKDIKEMYNLTNAFFDSHYKHNGDIYEL